MISPEQDLSPRKVLDERKIFPAFFQFSSPGVIAGKHKSILWLYDFVYILFNLSFMVSPDSPENIHGLVSLEAEMQVAERV